MGTENIPAENLDAPKPEPAAPAAPPAAPSHLTGYLSGLDITDEMIEGANWRDKDRLIVARAAAREARRAEDEKKVKASAESTARAKAVTDEVIQRGEKDGEEAEPKLLQPGAFELEVPDTLTPSQQKVAGEIAEDIAAIATHASIPQEEAQTILESALDIAATILPNGEDPNLANREECITVMSHRWGDAATKELIADAGKAYERLGPDVQAWLDARNEYGEQIGNSPAAIYALAMWQRGYTRMSPEKAASEVARLRATEQYQRGDKGFTDQVALLSKVATRGQSGEMPMSPRGGSPAALGTRPTFERVGSPQQRSQALQAEVDAIRKNPDYTSMDAKKRKPLVERMAALQTQIHGGA